LSPRTKSPNNQDQNWKDEQPGTRKLEDLQLDLKIFISTRSRDVQCHFHAELPVLTVNANQLYNFVSAATKFSGMHAEVLEGIVKHRQLKKILSSIKQFIWKYVDLHGVKEICLDIHSKHGMQRSVGLAIILEYILKRNGNPVIVSHGIKSRLSSEDTGNQYRCACILIDAAKVWDSVSWPEPCMRHVQSSHHVQSSRHV
jgi:hypothetical protein